MEKKSKRVVLEVGQKVFTELFAMFSSGEGRSIHEHTIVKANSSSAYTEDGLVIKQGTLKVKNTLGFHTVVWLTKEDFEKDVAYKEQKKSLQLEIKQEVNELLKKPNDELESLLATLKELK